MLSYKELDEFIKSAGFPSFRTRQIIQAVYKEYKQSFDEIHVLPADLREALKEKITFLSLNLGKQTQSSDGKTIKFLFKTHDGKFLETVIMQYKTGRITVCVSCQIGCQLGCSFCSTGKMGFIRNLSSEEITDQILFCEQHLNKKIHKTPVRVTNVVFMGMGEPFMNYDNVMSAVRNLNDEKTFNIGARSITISTSGITEGIEKLAEENLQVNLAVSLHAPTQELREKIMPIAKKYHLDDLMSAVKQYLSVTNRRVTYEYIMLLGINDGDQQAKELRILVKDQLCHINLIPYNTDGSHKYSKSGQLRIEKFKSILEKSNIPVTIRFSSGGDIAAACGQLANK